MKKYNFHDPVKEEFHMFLDKLRDDGERTLAFLYEYKNYIDGRIQDAKRLGAKFPEKDDFTFHFTECVDKGQEGDCTSESKKIHLCQLCVEKLTNQLSMEYIKRVKSDGVTK